MRVEAFVLGYRGQTQTSHKMREVCASCVNFHLCECVCIVVKLFIDRKGLSVWVQIIDSPANSHG